MKGLDEWKLVVPRGKRETVMEEIHYEPTAGHPGIDKTYKCTTQFYYCVN